MTTTTSGAISAATGAAAATKKSGLAGLGQGDFLKLMTTQLQQQDPFDPVDNKDMLAQMAQFTQLSGIAEMGDTLKLIAGKLDAVLSAQSATITTTTPPAA